MKEIRISNCDKFIIVDDEDYERLRSYTWYVSGNHSSVFRYSTEYGQFISIAKDVMRKSYQMYDHKDRNPFNNRKENLRPCSIQQNNCNKVKYKKNASSKYKGVHLLKKNNKWSVNIQVNGRNIHIGSFHSEDNAGIAYDRAAIKYFGEFAVLNFPEICLSPV